MIDTDIRRRTILQGAAGLALGPLLAQAANAAPAATNVPGNGDFNFLSGEWKIANRQRKAEGPDWSEFAGAATVHTVLGGLGSIEQLRIPASSFMGMGIRLFDLEKRLWADHWVNAKVGVVNPPMMGSFRNGVGTFIADESDGGRPVKSRGVWDRITPNSCRWYQSTSIDGGKTWDDNWFMDWTRV